MNYLLLSFALFLNPQDTLPNYPDEVLEFIVKHSDESYKDNSECTFVILVPKEITIPVIEGNRHRRRTTVRYIKGYSFCFLDWMTLYFHEYKNNIEIESLIDKNGNTEYSIKWNNQLIKEKTKRVPEKIKKLKVKQ